MGLQLSFFQQRDSDLTMHHETPLITTIAVGLVLAFIFGAIANRARLSPLVGYLLAGVVVGPATPGFVADVHLAPELAEIGVILLMFGVGLHFSLKELLSVKAIAIPGALVQIAFATALGSLLSWVLGWSLGAGLVFGLALSVASTVVLLRALQDRHLIETGRGKIAVGWLIVEDLAMVIALVLLPAFAGLLGGGDAASPVAPNAWDITQTVALTLAKVAAFVAIMLVAGRRVLPWALSYMAGTGSRELFTLSVLAVALGIAFASSKLFGVSFALGAFFAGMVLAGSELSHRAAEDSLPLRDAFAVLFFVSVGMVFDPMILVNKPLAVLATFLIITFGKSVAAYLIALVFGHSRLTALTISASLAQIGEFSFILASLGLSLNLLPEEGKDLILAGAILSILVNPLLFVAIDIYQKRSSDVENTEVALGSGVVDSVRQDYTQTSLLLETDTTTNLENDRKIGDMTAHTVVAGYGFVGQCLVQSLTAEKSLVAIIDDRQENISNLRQAGLSAVLGNAAETTALQTTNLEHANRIFIAVPNIFEAGQIAEKARRINPNIRIIARADTEAEARHLISKGADEAVIGRTELAITMLARSKYNAVPGAGS